MIPLYYEAVLKQAYERSRILKDKLAKPVQNFELATLRQRCEAILDEILFKLRNIESNGDLSRPEMFRLKINILKNIIEDLSRIETTGIAALDRLNADDVFLTRIIFHIHQEIGYPILPPVVTCLSQSYYSIYVNLNLIQVPLAETTSLLHLPDLYHEMGHTLAATINTPSVEPFTNSLGDLMKYADRHFEQEYIRIQRDISPQSYAFIYRQLQEVWVKYWSQEIFCDLFALYTLGPAYAWSHFHLVAEKCGNPFTVGFSNEHPPDDARMQALLKGLELIKKHAERVEINKKWCELNTAMNYTATPLYRNACPKNIIDEAALRALEGTRSICGSVAGELLGDRPICDLLNRAWQQFWKDPSAYYPWEKQALSDLKSQLAI